jgi:hypothetical protein
MAQQRPHPITLDEGQLSTHLGRSPQSSWGSLGGRAAGVRLLGTIPHPNTFGGDPEHLRERRLGIGPVPHQRP